MNDMILGVGVEAFIGKVEGPDGVLCKGIEPVKGTSRSAAFDLRTPYGFSLQPGETYLVNTGLIIQCPQAGAMLLLPRSGLSSKYGIVLANTIGLIDSDYCGPEDYIKVALKNTGQGYYDFECGDRIAQLLFIPVYEAFFSWSTDINFAKQKSRGGFGSTGVK